MVKIGGIKKRKLSKETSIQRNRGKFINFVEIGGKFINFVEIRGKFISSVEIGEYASLA